MCKKTFFRKATSVVLAVAMVMSTAMPTYATESSSDEAMVYTVNSDGELVSTDTTVSVETEEDSSNQETQAEETVTEEAATEEAATEGTETEEFAAEESATEESAAEGTETDDFVTDSEEPDTETAMEEVSDDPGTGTEAQTETETYDPYIILLPETDGVEFGWDEEHYSEEYSGDGYTVLLYEEEEPVMFFINTELEMSAYSSVTDGEDTEFTDCELKAAEDLEEMDEWASEYGEGWDAVVFSMPSADLYFQFTEIEESGQAEMTTAESEASESATELGTDETTVESETVAETDTPEETEEACGWVEYITTEGGSLSASFVYEGETYDEGTFTYDVMEYGPWEAMYETTGTVNVTAAADEGYVFEAITVTDGDGNVLAVYDTATTSVTPNADSKTIITASFVAEDSVESESDSETGASDETEEAYGWVEYVTTKGGSLSASFEYEGESYDEGTYTYDVMEYGPWEAQYETTGTVTVTASADEGYVFEAITVTDEDGNVLGVYDTETVSIIPNADCKTVITVSFTAAEEAVTETAAETEVLEETEVVETEAETESIETESEENEDIIAEDSDEEEDDVETWFEQVDGYPYNASVNRSSAYVWSGDTYFDLSSYTSYDNVTVQAITETGYDLSSMSEGDSFEIEYLVTLNGREDYSWTDIITFYVVDSRTEATVKSDLADSIIPTIIPTSGTELEIPELVGDVIEGYEYTAYVNDDEFDIYALTNGYDVSKFRLTLTDDGGFDISTAGDYTITFSVTYFLYPTYYWYVTSLVHVVEQESGQNVIVLLSDSMKAFVADEETSTALSYSVKYLTADSSFSIEVYPYNTNIYNEIDPSVSILLDEEILDTEEIVSKYELDDGGYLFEIDLPEGSSYRVEITDNGNDVWYSKNKGYSGAWGEYAENEITAENIEDLESGNTGDNSGIMLTASALTDYDYQYSLGSGSSVVGSVTVTSTANNHNPAGTSYNQFSCKLTSSAVTKAMDYILGLDGISMTEDDEASLKEFLGSSVTCGCTTSGASGWFSTWEFTWYSYIRVKINDDKTITVQLTIRADGANGYQSMCGNNLSSYELTPYKITVYKKVKYLSWANLFTNLKANAVFALYTADSKGNADEFIGTISLTDDGTGKSVGEFTDLDAGDYVLMETSNAAGLVYENYTYNITLDDENPTWTPSLATDEEEGTSGNWIVNRPYYYKGKLAVKTGTDGTGLPGFTFKVEYLPSKDADPEMTWYLVSDSNGAVYLSDDYISTDSAYKGKSDDIPYATSGSTYGILPYGYLRITEVATPDDSVYNMDTTERVVQLKRISDEEDENFGSIEYDVPTIVNEEYQQFEFLKVDANDTDKTLKGAEYKVYFYKDLTSTSQIEDFSDYDKVYRFVSDDDGLVVSDSDHLKSGSSLYESVDGTEGLPYGLCLVVEDVAPEDHEVNNSISRTIGGTEVDMAMIIKLSKDGVTFTGASGTTSKGTVYHVNEETTSHLTLVKSASNTSITSGNTGYSLKGAQYTVYTDSECTTVAKDVNGSKAILTVKDEDGTTNTLTMLPGTYYVKETKTPTGFKQDTDTHEITITSKHTEDNPYKLKVSDVPVTYTADLILEKKTTSNTEESLAGAIFQLDFYAGATSASGTATRTWYLTSKDGEEEGIAYVMLDSDYLASGYTSDSFYTKSNSTICLPIGYLVITEIQAPDGFVKTDDTVTYTFTTDGWKIVNSTGGSVSGSTASISNEMVQKAGYINNTGIAGGLSVQKIDYMLGSSDAHADTDLSGAEFTIVNASGKTVENKDGAKIPTSGLTGTSVTYSEVLAAAATSTMQVITTDASGYAVTDSTDLPYGTYYVIETKAATGYLLNETWVGYVEVGKNNVIYPAQTIQDTKSGQETVAQLPYMGGISVQKIDRGLGTNTRQGDATFAGAEFTIVNASASAAKNTSGTVVPTSGLSGSVTYSDVLTAAATSTMQVITADESGYAVTGANDLPYGTYYVIETKAPEGYELNTTWVEKVEIRSNGVIVMTATDADDPVTEGGLSVQKIDALIGTNTPNGDATLAGAEFTIVNASANVAENASGTVIPTSGLSGSVTYDQVLAAASSSTMQVITTDENGYASTGSCDLPYGTYYVIETKAPEGYELNTTWVEKIEVRKNGVVVEASTETEDTPKEGGLSVQKVDYMLGTNDNHGDTDLSGAEFTIVNASKNASTNKDGKLIPTSGLSGTDVTYADVLAAAGSSTMQVITTSADGSASTGNYDLPYGTYYVIETKSATGYLLNETWVGRIEVHEDESGRIYAAQTIQDDYSGQETTAQQIYRGGISLIKEDAELQASETQGHTSLEGAVLAIINASDAAVMNKDGKTIPSAKSVLSGTPAYSALRSLADSGEYTVQTITTGADGKASTGSEDLPYGTYYIIEVKSSYGYWIDETFVGKAVIRENGVTVSLGGTSDGSSFLDINDTEGTTVEQTPRRSDLNFLKLNIDGEYKSYIPFLISAIYVDDEGNETVLESHVIVSDADGLVDTSRTHSTNTNGFDQYVVDGAVTEEGEALLEEASTWGVWFGVESAVNDSYGALYPAYYRITEIQCKDNLSLQENLLQSERIYIYNDSADLTELLSNNAQENTYHPLVDTEILLESTASDTQDGGQVISASSSADVTDTVRYMHVSASMEYRLEVQFVDITDGTVLTVDGTNDNDAVVSDDGKFITKVFQPAKQSGTNNTYGTISISALINTSGLKGHTIVAVDYLYEHINGNWVYVANHNTDYSDESQMLYIPDIHTNAVDGLTESRVGTVDEGDYILDTVTYTNLAPKTNYVLVMYVADAETGEAVVTNEDGTPYTVTARIMKNSTEAMISGTKAMPAYYIDSSDLSGKTLVAVETLYLADDDDQPYGEPVVEATSIVDEDETIRYPEVHTSASDSLTLDDVGTSSETATVYDEVTVENVIFDDNDLDGQYTYTVTGTLVYQQDFTDADGVSHKAGEAVETLDGTLDTVTITSDAAGNATFTYVDGTEAKGSVTITGYGQNVSGTSNAYAEDTTAAIATITVELAYKVNSSKLEGSTVVVFEDLYHNGVKAASHADLTDEGQSVHYPEVHTSAAAASTGDDVGAVESNAVIVDTVILTNLVPGRTYTVSGKLVDQETGEDFLVNGSTVTQEAVITVGSDGTIVAANGESTTVTAYNETYSTVNGTVDLTFTFDASALEGETLVVFEDLVYNGVTVAGHADLTDEEQTIHYPEIRTTAADGYTEDSVGTVSGEAVIVDTVIYTNLVPGREYTVSGVLMNKETGEKLLDAEGNTVTAERTFTAGEAGDGITAVVDEAVNSVSGTIDITFTFDGSLLEGTTVVAFEDLEHNGITVTTHSDIDDEDETVHFPKVRTSAIDGNVGDEVGITGETVIVDTVSLWNLEPGMAYTVSGVLMDKGTGEELLVNGETVTQSVTITVNKDGTVTAENGENVGNVVYDEDMNSVDCTVELTYTLDASSLAGVTTVVFEDLIHNGVTVASHADITDLGQTIHFPEIHTTATDLDTSGHVGTVKENAVVNDVVYFTNLVAGKEYTLTGTLMDRENGLPILNEDGTEVTTSATFTAGTESSGDYTVTAYHADNNSVDGTYLITFTLDSSLLAGKTVVAFEDLYHNGVEVTSHADLEDNEQSVYYPDIHTTAADTDTGDHVGSIWGVLINFVRNALTGGSDEDTLQTITDTVALENLVPGMTYVVSGKLYNVTESHETGVETPLVIDGEEITQCVTITVSEDGSSITAADGSKTSVTAYNEALNSVDGTVDLVYTLDSSKIQGIEVVVFEKLYQDITYTPETNPEDVNDEDIVNEHSDLEDEGQSVSEVSISTTAVDTATGDHVGSVPDGSSVSIIHDEVNLAGLVEGMEYTIDGVLVSLGDSDIENGVVYYLKADGTLTDDRSEAYTESKTFTAEGTSETHYLNFSIASDYVQGRTLTVFENIYHNDVLISSHPDGDGEGLDEEELTEQTVYYPAGKTNATDTETGEHMSLADEDRVIVDRVYFENLLVGQEYTVTGQLVYKEAFTDADGVNHAAGEAVTDTVPVTFTAAEGLAEAYYEDGSTAEADSVTAKTLATGQTVISGYVSIRFTVDASKLAGATLVAFESFSHNGADIYTHNDLTDLPQTIKIPKISTTASVLDLDEAAIYNEDGSFADITITDTVTYRNLWTADELSRMAVQAESIIYLDGTTRAQDGAIYSISEDAVYILKGTLMDKATGEALMDSKGNTYVVYSEPFTPDDEDGTYDIQFILNAGDFLDEDGNSALAGASLVVFEDLYLAGSEGETADGNKAAEHHDIDDVDQDIRFPDTRTHATDGSTSYGTSEGTDDVMDALAQAHEADSSTDHEADASESMVITDLVAYENLHGGTEYTVAGTLQRVTGDGTWEEAVDDDGNVITAAATFTTDGSYEDSVSGTVTLKFTFSGVSLAGKTLVAFETISREGVNVAVHADITDEAQTIYVPEIGTQASDALTGISETVANSRTYILDLVSYTNLENGKEYTLNGVLYDDVTDDRIDSSSVTGTFVAGAEDQIITKDGTFTVTADEMDAFLGSTTAVTAWTDTASEDTVEVTEGTGAGDAAAEAEGGDMTDRASGSIYVLLEVDTSELGGHTVVVFENLYAENSFGAMKQVASHEDADDESQSVNIPLIRTSATVDNGEKAVLAGGTQTVTDTVSYNNLVAGQEYKVRGLLMDKTAGTSTGITAETTFTPEESDGTVTLSFEVNTDDYASHELVVFEELAVEGPDGEGVIVGEHKDIDDASQTVLITVPTPAAVQTGDNLNLLPAAIIILIVVLLVVLGIFLSKKGKAGTPERGALETEAAEEGEEPEADAAGEENEE